MTLTMEAWEVENRRQLADALTALRAVIDAYAGLEVEPTPEPDPPTAVSALDRLCRAFELTPFERSVILLCAGVELDGGGWKRRF